MSVYVIADTHFNHANIITYENRPFKGCAEMNRFMIDRWNEVVEPEDTVYHLGDFGFRGANGELAKIFNELKGHKHLLIGNHDRKDKAILALPWESQNLMLGITVDGQRYHLGHYPMENWEYQDPKEGNSIHIHGHIHSNQYMTAIPNRFCVSVEVIDYTPVDITVFKSYQTLAKGRHPR